MITLETDLMPDKIKQQKNHRTITRWRFSIQYTWSNFTNSSGSFASLIPRPPPPAVAFNQKKWKSKEYYHLHCSKAKPISRQW